MAVIARKFDSGKIRKYKMNQSTTVTKNTFGAFSSGYLVPADSSTAELRVLILETVTTGSGVYTEVLCVDLDSSVELEIDTAGDTSQALIGTKIDLTNASTANQAASTTDVLYVRGLVGATTNRKILANIVTKTS